MAKNTESGDERLWNTIGNLESYARERDDKRFYRALIWFQRCLFLLGDSQRGAFALPIVHTLDGQRMYAFIGVGTEDTCQPTTLLPNLEKPMGLG